MNINYDYKQCIGLKVKPRRGDALLFYSMFNNGTFDKVKPIKKSISISHVVFFYPDICAKNIISYERFLYPDIFTW